MSTRDRLRDLANAEVKLREACQLLHCYLDDSATEEKRAILEMPSVRVTTTSDGVDIAGVIPLEATQPAGASPCSLTTGQTSGCLCPKSVPSGPPIPFLPFVEQCR